MADEIALYKDVDRGAKAKALLDNEMLVETLAWLDQAYVSAWRATEPRDTEARELAWLSLKALELLKSHLSTVVIDGSLAQAELDSLLKTPTK